MTDAEIDTLFRRAVLLGAPWERLGRPWEKLGSPRRRVWVAISHDQTLTLGVTQAEALAFLRGVITGLEGWDT